MGKAVLIFFPFLRGFYLGFFIVFWGFWGVYLFVGWFLGFFKGERYFGPTLLQSMHSLSLFSFHNEDTRACLKTRIYTFRS